MNVSVDFNQKLGSIKPVHGVGQPPYYGFDFSMFRYLKEAYIPFSRLHDVGGWLGGDLYVDIPNIFRDFSANPYDPDSYDFAFTDRLLAALAEYEVEPFFRLGVTIENFAYEMKSRRLCPPADFHKWAVVCEHIIRHYNYGWADGFHYNIRYWEIWNEPDNNEDMPRNVMWQGTKEEFYELYDVASKHLKAKFPEIKVGGYAVTNFFAAAAVPASDRVNATERHTYYITFFDGFLDYVKTHNCPLDFFSWHSYDGIDNTRAYAEYCRKRLDEAGFTQTETSCNEWNFFAEKRGTMEHAALNTANLLMLQKAPVDNAMFYDARLGPSIYGGLFNPMTRTPLPLYYGFKAFGALYALGTEVEAQSDWKDVYVIAAADGKNGGVVIANVGEEVPLALELQGQRILECQRVVSTPSLEGMLESCPLPATLGKDTVYFLKTEA